MGLGLGSALCTLLVEGVGQSLWGGPHGKIVKPRNHPRRTMVQEAGVQRVFSPAAQAEPMAFPGGCRAINVPPPPNLSSPGDPYLCPTFVIMDPDERDLGMQPNSQLSFFH